MDYEGACHNGNAMELLGNLESESIHHTITDPPYEEEAHFDQVKARKDERSRFLEAPTKIELSFAPLDEDVRGKYASEITRITRGWGVVFCQVEAVERWRKVFIEAGASYKRTCIWIKPNAMPQFSGDRPAQGYEAIVTAWCGPGRSKWNGGGKVGNYVHPIPRGERRYHETQKPFSLMAELLSDFTNPGELVLDPFAGSGTTLIAAQKLGRRFIGFELNADYCKIANDRIQDPLFLPERQSSVQLGLF